MDLLNLIIVFSIFGVFSALGHDISNAFHQAYSDIHHFALDISNPGIGAISIISSGTQTFFGNFVDDVIDPVFNYGDSIIIDITKDLINAVADVTGFLIGIPEGFIDYFSHALGNLGILGFPATMVVIGIGIVIIVAVGLFIFKLAQYLIEVL